MNTSDNRAYLALVLRTSAQIEPTDALQIRSER